MSYPGGKSGAGVYQAIINQMPPHELYIEPFVGGAGVLRRKRSAPASIAIDRSGPVVRDIASLKLPGVTVIAGCGIEFLERRQWSGREFVYCDPPYVLSTRSSPRDLYDYELNDAGHARLLAVLQRLPCPVAVSGYWSKLYADALASWRTVTFQAMTRGGHTATEWLWMNYPEPVALHDYRYLGADYRERERIRRKIGRWQAKFDALPILERRGILSALLAVDDSDNAGSDGSDVRTVGIAGARGSSPSAMAVGSHRRR